MTRTATIVPLVKTATTLLMMLLSLGVMADAFNRRWMMFVIEVYVIIVSLLAVRTKCPAGKSTSAAREPNRRRRRPTVADVRRGSPVRR